MLDEMQKIGSVQGDIWKKQAIDGETLEAIEGPIQILNDLILNEVEQEAFNTLKNPVLDMTDLNQLYQLRALVQTVDLIRKKINQKVQQGKNARTSLKQLNSTPEGE